MRRVLAIATTLLFVLPSASVASAAPVVAYPPIEGIATATPPTVTAVSWVLYDDTYGVTLAAKDEHEQRAMASTTKIMTALVALADADPDLMVTVSARAAGVGESEAGLVAGETLPMHVLIKAMLVASANDAAVAVAEGTAGSVEAFVTRMNDEAAVLGLDDTHFTNPHGLDQSGHYTSASDLLTLARTAMDDPDFAEDVATKRYRLPAAPDGTVRVAATTNLLLSDYDGAIGVKTGHTDRAGLVLVAAAERDGRRLYAVVMGSTGVDGNFRDAEALLDFGFDEFGVVPVVMTGSPVAVLRSGGSAGSITAAADLEAYVHLATADLVPVDLGTRDGKPSFSVADAPVAVTPPDAAALPNLAGAGGWFARYLDWFRSR